VITPAYGQFLSDATGLANQLDVQIGEHTFEVETVSNFDIPDFEFDGDKKKLTLYISSGLENNLGEIIIPHDFLGGNLTFYLNDQEYFPRVNSNEKISFVTLNFTGSGNNTLEIFGTTNLLDLTEKDEMEQKDSSSLQKGETFDDSLMWLALIGFLIVVAAFTVMKIKKRNQV
jgi:hypothetical protein